MITKYRHFALKQSFAIEFLKNEFSIYFCFVETVNSSSFVNLEYGIFQQL
ncbi:hypothetical protein LEP1GSC021_0655 [Leptospira noguchii str. 1993005606]|uniref:Uncharacterized protein n=1 Tax=Leptospira noguchii str. 2001034031 TaxID=1193053 RepID=M6Y0K1_9LEPT|nr:hypothetical protein LEP1GSC024_3667 [Leptospira noguchii str. 2001034031]EPE82376.1 hypothetical protein LEP1GSC021_0655 [Leptospira noguchii str. 1993005606]